MKIQRRHSTRPFIHWQWKSSNGIGLCPWNCLFEYRERMQQVFCFSKIGNVFVNITVMPKINTLSTILFLTFCLSIAFNIPSISPTVTICFRNISFSANSQSVTCKIDLSKLARSIAVAGMACFGLVFCRNDPGTYGSDDGSENEKYIMKIYFIKNFWANVIMPERR